MCYNQSVFEKDPQAGKVSSDLGKKKKSGQIQYYFVHCYEEELNITINNNSI